MDIHKPKPAHSLREFVSEIAVIVCGILIALSLEELVRVMHERSLAKEARESAREEIRQNIAFMQGRLTTQDCVERRLDEIGDLLAASADGALSPAPRWISQPSYWVLNEQRWQAATASGRASLLPSDEQGRVDGVYSVMSRFNDSIRQEQLAWAQLRGLEEWRGSFGPAERLHFREALQQARYELWEIRVTIELARTLAKQMAIEAEAPQVMGKGYSIPHAVCLPIDTPREKALELLSKDGSPPFGQPK